MIEIVNKINNNKIINSCGCPWATLGPILKRISWVKKIGVQDKVGLDSKAWFKFELVLSLQKLNLAWPNLNYIITFIVDICDTCTIQ